MSDIDWYRVGMTLQELLYPECTRALYLESSWNGMGLAVEMMAAKGWDGFELRRQLYYAVGAEGWGWVASFPGGPKYSYGYGTDPSVAPHAVAIAALRALVPERARELGL